MFYIRLSNSHNSLYGVCFLMLYFSCGRPYNQIEAGDGTLDRSDGTTHSLNRAGNSL